MIMLSKLLWSIASIAITLTIYSVQKHLSTRKNWKLGVIVPLLSIVVMTIVYFCTTKILNPVQFIVPCALLLSMEILIWADGRRQYRKEELMRMKIKDID